MLWRVVHLSESAKRCGNSQFSPVHILSNKDGQNIAEGQDNKEVLCSFFPGLSLVVGECSQFFNDYNDGNKGPLYSCKEESIEKGEEQLEIVGGMDKNIA